MEKIDYLVKDFHSFMDYFTNLIPQKTPEWTDTSKEDMGMVILETVAHGLDILSYYQDETVNELILPTSTQRQNVINLCRFLNYTLRPAKPATTDITFNFTPQTSPVVIEQGFRVATDPQAPGEEEIIFETDEEAVLEVGEEVITIPATEGKTIPTEVIGNSDGGADQTFFLNRTNAIFDSLVISVEDEFNEQQEWERVETFIDSGSDSLHYKAFEDPLNRIFVTFGDGIHGKIPMNGAHIFADYRLGGGKVGNVGAETLIKPKTTLPGLTSVINEEQATGGEDQETVEEAKEKAPLVHRTRYQAISKEDYEVLAETISGVKRAYAEPAAEWFPNGVTVYLIPTDGDYTSQATKNEVEEYLSERVLLTTQLFIEDPSYIEVDLTVDLYIRDGFDENTIHQEAHDRLDDLLSIQKRDFKDSLYLSNVTYTLMNIGGVNNAVVQHPEEDIILTENNQVIKKGMVTVNIL